MQEANINKPSDFDDGIDLLDLFNILLAEKWMLAAITAFVSTVAVIYSLLLPNIYESKALLFSVDSSNSISRAIGSYSGLAGLAGINLPTDAGSGNTAKAIETLSSLSFFENNILINIYLPNLMAVRSWDPKTKTINFDESIYNINSNTWIKDPSKKKGVPSAQESFDVFRKHLRVRLDKDS